MTKKWILVAAKVAISVALIAYVVSKVDLTAAMERVRQVSSGMLALAILAFLLQYVVCGFRWRAVLSAIGGRLPLATALRYFYIGAFFHQVLPASVGGDAVRTYLIYRDGMGLRTALNGIVLERVATVSALVLLVAVVQPLFLPRADAATADLMISIVAVAVSAIIGGIVLLAFLDRLPESVRGWRILRALANLGSDTRAIFLSPLTAARILAWAALGHANLTVAVYFLARGLDVDIGLADCFALFLPVLLLTAMPVSIGGWGVREGGLIYAFGLIGVASADALVVSVLYGLLATTLSLPGGLVWLASGGRPRDVKAALGKAQSAAQSAGK